MKTDRPTMVFAICAISVGACFWWRQRRRRCPFGFDIPIDRRDLLTVKHKLSEMIYGKDAANGLQMWSIIFYLIITTILYTTIRMLLKFYFGAATNLSY